MKRFIITIAVLLLLAGGAAWWLLRPTGVAYLTDAATIHEAATTATVREVLWQPPALLPGVVNSTGDAFEPRISTDGRTFFFVRGRPGGGADIYTSSLEQGAWGEARPLEVVNSDHDELGPEVSADGRRLYFYSDRPGGMGGYDIWVSRRVDGAWTTPENLGARVNTPYNEYSPALAPDARLLCFASNRPRLAEDLPRDDAWRATVREDIYQHDYDLYSAELTDSGVASVVALGSLNTSSNEGSPAFSSLGDFLYFASDRPGGKGGFDLYRSRITRGLFTAPTNLGSAVNTSANELDPSADLGGFALHFSSDRPVEGAENKSSRSYHIYRTSSREVYRDIEWRHSNVDWLGLWRQVGPNLAWSILALLALLFLIAVLRDAHRRRLSLMARCLLVSLMVHALLMLWFNVVRVTGSVASFVRAGSGGIKVAMLQGGGANRLAAQMRGSLSQAPAVAMPSLETRRVRQSAVIPTEARPVFLPMAAANRRQDGGSLVTASLHESQPADVQQRRFNVPAGISDSGISTQIQLPTETIQSKDSEPTGSIPTIGADRPLRPASVALPTDSLAASGAIGFLKPETTSHSAGGNSLVTDSGPSIRDSRPGVAPGPSSSLQFVPAGLALAEGALGLPGSVDGARESSGEAAVSATTPRLEVPSRASIVVQAIGTSASVPAEIHGVEPAAERAGLTSVVPGAGSNVVDSSMTVPALPAGPMSVSLAQADAPPIGLPSDQPGADGAVRATEAAIDVKPSAPAGLARAAINANVGSGSPNAAPQFVVTTPEASSWNSPTVVAASTMDQSTSRDIALPSPGNPSIAVPSASVPDFELPGEIAQAPETNATPDAVESEEVFGRIAGRVIDADSGRAIAGARIRVDVAGRGAVEAATDSSGSYSMALPQLPEFFAVSASSDGFLPRTRNVEAQTVRGRTRRLNFRLPAESQKVVAIEDSPIVHHLGNDAFEGVINSQFQRSSEGRVFSASFQLRSDQTLPSIASAELELLAKGVQCPHKLRINGVLIETRLDQSPADGGFGLFVAEVDPSLLKAGANTLEIRAVSCRGDLDDFEFVNIQIKLHPAPH